MRRRIVGLAVMASVVALVLFAVPLGVVVARYFVSDERSELTKIADSLAVSVSGDLARQRDPTVTPERGTSVAVYNGAGRKVSGSGPDRANRLVQRALRGAESSGTTGGRLAAAVPVTDGDTVTGAVLATTTRSDVNGRIARAWAEMLGLGVVAVLITWLLARALSRRLARPIEQLAQATQRLGDRDFTVRTTAAGVPEIDAANAALNRAADRIGTLVERERAFSSDASHQLRTPLAGLRLELEAALDRPDADDRAAMRSALGAADQLEATIDDLLALARDTSQSGPVDVAPLLDQVRQRWNGPLAAAGRPLYIEAPTPLRRVRISAAAAGQILEVLLDNAQRHGRGPVTVTLRDVENLVAIDVADTGPAISGDPRALFVRRSAAAAGHGIGLALARSLAESEGGRLVLSRPDPPTFTLLVPAEQPVADRPAGRDRRT
ncbi:MAG TPA: HAMP domain-containing sensor histidine kinase [Jatrophihabitantaceae bacterium]|jgi:signal transduction histidine kinase